MIHELPAGSTRLHGALTQIVNLAVGVHAVLRDDALD